MSINTIAMLTYRDKTVSDALQIFEENKKSKVKCWGFKDIGIDVKDAVKLVSAFKMAGKITFLEPLIENEDECIKAAELAVKCKFDYVIGMKFHKSVMKILKDNDIKYFPTCGKRAGLPRMLYGTPESIIEDAERIISFGADGICLSVYRYLDGDPEDMASKFAKRLKVPFIISGGINSLHRLNYIKGLKPWGFTIGSALFDNSFSFGNTIAEKLDNIKVYLSK